jgi:integrase
MAKALRRSAGLDDGPPRKQMLLLLILGGFFGLRYSEAIRARWEDIDFKTGELHVKEMKTEQKGIAERWVTILPVAKAWLYASGVEKSGPIIAINSRNLRAQRNTVLAEAKMGRWIHNVLRRSYASYHLAAFEDAAKTAREMGHTDAKTTLAKYNVARRRADGLEWFKLTPKVVCSQKYVEGGERYSPPSKRKDGRAT